MRIYVSGPIAGMPDRNEPAFRAAAAMLEKRGHEVIVPHDIPAWNHAGRPCPRGYDASDEHTSACFLRGDLVALAYCDAAYFLDGWEYSRGAELEHKNATFMGLLRYYASMPLHVPTFLPLNAADAVFRAQQRHADLQNNAPHILLWKVAEDG